ncbi:hypothetical protein BUALT_Bualt02G0030700 [Buddleja alternifolia]|uniref:AP2/ERF domain-containing protein n=1 Tax=Buddleja alternifolia TaxID=168488 RepID=A0AAV6XWX1_9LAMI|nr:hypothetical protein BUALT_Bualt02G0030700 [Buddleja alternifolia]
MDYESKQSPSSSSSSSLEIITPNDPKRKTPIIIQQKHKRKAGRKIFKETRHPVYRGVRRKNGRKWVCEVREPNKKSRIWLGTFPNPETAAVAHDVAALALRGDNPPLNFPELAPRLPRPESSSHQDIQRAALQAARDFKPSSFNACPSSPSSSSITSLCQNEGFACDNYGEERVLECEDSGMFGFVDEEAMFNMPGLLDSMAEGMLLTPLAMKKGFNWSQELVDDEIEFNLWGR